jgi:hypothetical protein
MSPKPMGRPRLPANTGLPPRMSARRLKRATHYYYRTATGGAIPLGPDLAAAKVKWSQLEQAGAILPDDAWLTVSARYQRDGLAGKAPKTVREYTAALKRLDTAFRGARLRDIRPMHISQYLDRRSAPVAANREIAVLSAVYNWSRARGITDHPNPAAGIARRSAPAREVYVTDAQFRAVRDHADARCVMRSTSQCSPVSVRPTSSRCAGQISVTGGCGCGKTKLAHAWGSS